MIDKEHFNYYFIPSSIQSHIPNPTYPIIHVISICSDENKMKYLKKTAELHKLNNIHYVIIEWQGFVDKIIYMIKILDKIPDGDVVCFIDAYDILISNNVECILEKFISFNCNILFSSELVCYPSINRERYEQLYDNDHHAKIKTNYKYLNSGGYIGYRKNIYQMLTFQSMEDIKTLCQEGGDQNYFTQYYLNHDLAVKLDVNQTIFQSMCCVQFQDFEFQNGYLYNKILDTYPSFIHFNGFGDDKIKCCFDTNQNRMVDVIKTFYEKMKISSEKGECIKLNYYQQFDNLYIDQK